MDPFSPIPQQREADSTWHASLFWGDGGGGSGGAPFVPTPHSLLFGGAGAAPSHQPNSCADATSSAHVNKTPLRRRGGRDDHRRGGDGHYHRAPFAVPDAHASHGSHGHAAVHSSVHADSANNAFAPMAALRAGHRIADVEAVGGPSSFLSSPAAVVPFGGHDTAVGALRERMIDALAAISFEADAVAARQSLHHNNASPAATHSHFPLSAPHNNSGSGSGGGGAQARSSVGNSTSKSLLHVETLLPFGVAAVEAQLRAMQIERARARGDATRESLLQTVDTLRSRSPHFGVGVGVEDRLGILPKTVPTAASEAAMTSAPPSPAAVQRRSAERSRRSSPLRTTGAAVQRGAHASLHSSELHYHPPQRRPPWGTAWPPSPSSQGDVVATADSSALLSHCPHCRKVLLPATDDTAMRSIQAGGGGGWPIEQLRAAVLHPSVCAYRKVACKACGEHVTARYAKDHAAQCPAARVSKRI